MERLLRVLGVLAVLAAGSESATAGTILNGSFETGTYSGYTTSGITSIVTSSFGVNPTDGTHQALISTNLGVPPAPTGATLEVDLDTFLGLTGSNALVNFDSKVGQTAAGSAFQQTFLGNAGDVITFSFDYLTNESPANPPAEDFAFYVLDGTTHLLADPFSNLAGGAVGSFASSTGYSTITLSALSLTGTHTIGFGVVNTNDETIPSGLLIDNIKITPNAAPPASGSAVPEPASMSLLATGSLGMLGFRLRRRNAPATVA